MFFKRAEFDEIVRVQDIAPNGWLTDFEELAKLYSKEGCFNPILVSEDKSQVAFGHSMDFGETAWLGNIIVKEDKKRNGIGKSLVNTLIKKSFERGSKTVILTATEEGEYLYRSLGFIEDTTYYFYKGKYEGEISNNIRRIEEIDKDLLFEIHNKVTGEKKDSFLMKDIIFGYKYLDKFNNIKGFYLPTFGQGLILAIDKHAGLELLKVKHYKNDCITAIPRGNELGIKFFEENGFIIINKGKRMYFGKEVKWYEEYVFSRGNAYTG